MKKWSIFSAQAIKSPPTESTNRVITSDRFNPNIYDAVHFIACSISIATATHKCDWQLSHCENHFANATEHLYVVPLLKLVRIHKNQKKIKFKIVFCVSNFQHETFSYFHITTCATTRSIATGSIVRETLWMTEFVAVIMGHDSNWRRRLYVLFLHNRVQGYSDGKNSR